MTNKITDTAEAWENGELGREAEHAEVYTTSAEEESAINDALGLKAISIRLEVELIEGLKAIAKHHKIGYQPLMRQALHRFVDSELKRIALEKINEDEPQEVSFQFPRAA